VIGGRATTHMPDAEVSWPDLPDSAYPGECWAIEAELTPKPLTRTAAIMAGLLTRTADYHPDAAPAGHPPLGDVLGQVPDKIKQRLFDAFDVQPLYSKTHNQVTFWATITPSTPAALAAIIAASETPDLTALLAAHTGQDHVSDLASQPGAAKPP